MNILRFVNSGDVRAHLESIGWEPSPTEAAWLICRSRNHTLKERHASLRQLAEEYPDAPFGAECADGNIMNAYTAAGFGKLSDYIRFYTDTEEKLLCEFRKNDGSFAFCIYPLNEEAFIEGDFGEVFTRVFREYEACVEALKKRHKQASDQYGDLTDRAKYQICCRPLDDAPPRLSSVTVRGDGGIMSLTDPEGWDGIEELSPYHLFDFMWFPIPVPFQKGDIIWDPERGESGFCRGPVVMCDITPEYFARTKRRGSDDTDMNVWGYFQNDDGTIYKEVTSNYMDFEYYPPEKLTGRRRIMKALSRLVKGEIDVGQFSASYLHILAEEAVKLCELAEGGD